VSDSDYYRWNYQPRIPAAFNTAGLEKAIEDKAGAVPPPPPPTRLMYAEDLRVGMRLRLGAESSSDPLSRMLGSMYGRDTAAKYAVVLDIRTAGSVYSLIVLGDDGVQRALSLHAIQTQHVVVVEPVINGDALLFEVIDEHLRGES